MMCNSIDPSRRAFPWEQERPSCQSVARECRTATLRTRQQFGVSSKSTTPSGTTLQNNDPRDVERALSAGHDIGCHSSGPGCTIILFAI